MSFELDSVVPWGRRLSEYQEMFGLSDQNIKDAKIISFGDGPASFNAEGTQKGGHIVSVDPIYQLLAAELKDRIYKTKDIIIEQTERNMQNYRWDKIKNVEELVNLRMSAMNLFLDDYDQGRVDNRYMFGELPDTNFPDSCFDLGLSSHFLFLYATLGMDFHLKAIHEMLRICGEVRIFPICDLDGNQTALFKKVFDCLSKTCQPELVKTSYEFQKGANEMLVITK